VITRTYKVDRIEQVNVAMDFLKGGAAERIGIRCLKQVLMTKPRTYMIKRTPLATRRRYDYYNRKDGKVTRTGHTSGSVKALRNAVQNNPVRDTSMPNSVTFGAHAPSTLEYAGYVHEAVKPREGQYWTEGMLGYGRGWTTQGTGNKYVTMAVEEYADYIPDAVNKLIDRELKGMSM
jgi:hypothetical protein